jgi:hypothetical protein
VQEKSWGKKERRTFRRRTHSFSLFLFLCPWVDDKKMERLFPSVPPKNIKKRDRVITIGDR